MNEFTIDEHGRYCGVKIVALSRDEASSNEAIW